MWVKITKTTKHGQKPKMTKHVQNSKPTKHGQNVKTEEKEAYAEASADLEVRLCWKERVAVAGLVVGCCSFLVVPSTLPA